MEGFSHFDAELALEIMSNSTLFSKNKLLEIKVDIDGEIMSKAEMDDMAKIKKMKEYENRAEEIKSLLISLNEKVDRRSSVLTLRETRVKELEDKVKNPNYRKLVKLRTLQESLRKLEDIYYKMSFRQASNEKLEELKERIQIAKAKILILKRNIKF